MSCFKFNCDNSNDHEKLRTSENTQGYVSPNIVKSEKINNTPINYRDDCKNITVSTIITGDTNEKTNSTPVNNKNNNNNNNGSGTTDRIFPTGYPIV